MNQRRTHPTFDNIYFYGSVIKGIKVAFKTLAEEESRGSKLVNKGQVLLSWQIASVFTVLKRLG